jgi:hypothetical protein
MPRGSMHYRLRMKWSLNLMRRIIFFVIKVPPMKLALKIKVKKSVKNGNVYGYGSTSVWVL